MTVEPPPHAYRPRFLARPRRFGEGFALSVAAHALVALVFLLVWALLPLPPIVIRIHDVKGAPTRAEIGVDATGRPGPDFRAADPGTP